MNVMAEIEVACPMCGDINAVDSDYGSAVCQSCGAVFAVPEMNEEPTVYNERSAVEFDIRSGVLEAYGGSGPVAMVPAGVTAIGGQAFKECEGLRRVILPEGVTEIQSSGEGMWGAFFGCRSLETVELPSTLVRIGSNAFNGCTKLANIDLPDSVTNIGPGAFCGCTALASVKLSKGLRDLPNDIFRSCVSLTDIKLNGNIKTIGNNAFADCCNIRAFSIPPGIKTIGSFAFSGCTGLTDITLPATLVSLGASAFSDCRNLCSINIPAAVEFETDGSGVRTFAGCSALKEVIIGKLPDNFAEIFAATPWLEIYLVKQGRCRHCGGNFKGVFKKVCEVCGLPKDY